MEIRTDKIKSKLGTFLGKSQRYLNLMLDWILPAIFLMFVVYSVYIWYVYAFNSNWSEEKKADYVRTKQRDVIFEKDKFDSVTSSIKEKKTNYQKNPQDIPNLFKL